MMFGMSGTICTKTIFNMKQVKIPIHKERISETSEELFSILNFIFPGKHLAGTYRVARPALGKEFLIKSWKEILERNGYVEDFVEISESQISEFSENVEKILDGYLVFADPVDGARGYVPAFSGAGKKVTIYQHEKNIINLKKSEIDHLTHQQFQREFSLIKLLES